MRKILTTGAALLLAFGATTVQAHDPAARRAAWLEERLELTEAQREEVSAIFGEAREQRAELRAQAREQRKARREQSKAIGESTQERLAAVLTEEQSAELSEMREKMNRRAIMKHGKRGARRGPGMERRGDMARGMMRFRRSHEQTEAPASQD